MNINHTLRAHNLHLIRHEQHLINSVSFDTQSGDILIIGGPNGAGKSTLLRILAGFILPTSGQCRWQHESTDQRDNEPHNHFHFISHGNGLKLDLSVAENIQLTMLLTNSTLTPQPHAILSQLGLHQNLDRRARDLSAGQKRQLCLARLLLSYKPLWLLDEPFTALDQQAKTFWRAAIEAHALTGGIVIMSTHEPIFFAECQTKHLTLGHSR